MNDGKDKATFIGYVGRPEFHDAVVTQLRSSVDSLEVWLRDPNRQVFRLHFLDVSDVKSNHPEGMVLYAIAELRATPPLRRFSFVNWSESDDASLEVTAVGYRIERMDPT